MKSTHDFARKQSSLFWILLSQLFFTVSILNAQTLFCGDVVQGTLVTLGSSNTYTFGAISGDVVRVTSVSKSGGVQPDIQIFNPSNVHVGGFGYNDGFSTITLTNNGTFTIRVLDRGNNNTGNYSLSLIFATPKCSGIVLGCGSVVTNGFTDQAEQHTYTLTGAAGDVVRLTSVSKTGGVGPDIDVFNSSGVYVGGWGYNDGFTTLLLTNSETFRVLVRDRGNNNTGTYTLGVVYATPKCSGVELSCSRVITNIITDPSQQNFYVLHGFAGEVIHITSTPASGSIGPDVDVFNSNGSYLGGFGYNDFISKLTLTNTGIHTVIVRDRGNNNTGSYNLDLDVLGGCVRLNIDQAVVRTQQVACIPIRIFAGSPASLVSFTLQLPTGYFGNVSLSTGGRFTNATFVPGTNSQWFVTMQTSAESPLIGNETVGTLCLTSLAQESVFTYPILSNLAVTNVDNTVPSTAANGGRVVVVADKSLLEAWVTTNGQRMYTIYGKANTNYVVRFSTNVTTPAPWTPGWSNTIPTALYYNQTLQGGFSNAPILFLRAEEQ